MISKSNLTVGVGSLAISLVAGVVVAPVALGEEESAGEIEASDVGVERLSTLEIDLGPGDRRFGAVAVDAAGVCIAMLTPRGDLWTLRDNRGLVSSQCRIDESASLGSPVQPALRSVDARLDLLVSGVDEFVGISYTDSGSGRWQFAASGRVLSYGDAEFYGDLATLGITPNGAIVGGVAMPDDSGYWLFAADGGVFAFGDAPFLGSVPGALGAIGLSSDDLAGPIVAMTVIGNGAGYYLFGADGGVFAFGDAPYLGSIPGSVSGSRANSLVVGAIAWQREAGYTMVTSTGEAVGFGGRDYGDLSNVRLLDPIVAVSATPDDSSYFMIDSLGRIFPFGDSFMCKTQGVGCGPPLAPGSWLSVEIAGVRVSDDRRTLELVPTRYYPSSCTELRGTASFDDTTLVVDLQKRPTDLNCTPYLTRPPDAHTTTVLLDESLPQGVDVRFEPELTGVPYDGEANEIDLIRRLRGNLEMRTTPHQAEVLLSDPDFQEGWAAYLPYSVFGHSGLTRMGPRINLAYEYLVRTTLRSLEIDEVVAIFWKSPFLTVLVLPHPDPEVDIRDVITEAWQTDTTCLERLYDECVNIISTHSLQKVSVKVITKDLEHYRCGGFANVVNEISDKSTHFANSGWITHRGQTADTLAWALRTMSAALDDVVVEGIEIAPVLGLAADKAEALVIPALWEGDPPWLDPSILQAWNLLSVYALESCGLSLRPLTSG